ncbi:MAG: MgtC/SapB family protein [Bacteroidales bacterium]|nr:MgtC/SapB family protein [Bacteroidales bacterium]
MENINYDHLLRIFAAALLGGIIGLEREYRSKMAGFRTHFLVAMGSAIFMIMSIHGFDSDLPLIEKNNYSLDPARIAANIVTGIGFIGAGAIIFQKNIVRGITTAAGIWVTAAIGMACGSGNYTLSITTTLLVLICLETFNFILSKMGRRTVSLSISAHSRYEISTILDKLRSEGYNVETFNIEISQKNSGKVYILTVEVKVKRKDYDKKLSELISGFDEISVANIQG